MSHERLASPHRHSEWTLDYPPFFAWFERVLALGAPLFDPGMLVVSATPYVSAATVVYQRLTVMLTDGLLLVGARRLVAVEGSAADDGESAPAAVALVFLNAGLLLVDHVHFQYNGMLVGLLLLAVAELRAGRERRAAVLFAALLNFKHLFLFAAPLYFVYLLRGHVLRVAPAPPAPPRAAGWAGALGRLVLLGAPVALVFALSLAPFAYFGQLAQLLTRLFPFGRGLTHAYWAPNTWALYTAADKALAFVLRRGGGGAGGGGSAGTGGLVGETPLAVLPAVQPRHTALLVLLLQAPVLWRTWRAPRAASFAPACAVCGLAAFLVGWHVHEKAVLPPLLLLLPLRPSGGGGGGGGGGSGGGAGGGSGGAEGERRVQGAQLHARLLLLLSASGQYALLPLLHRPTEAVLARAALCAYACALTLALRSRLRRLGTFTSSSSLSSADADAAAEPPSAAASAASSAASASASSAASAAAFAAAFAAAPLGLRLHERLYLAGFLPLELLCALVLPLAAPRLPFLPLLCTSVYCAAGVHYAFALALAFWWRTDEEAATHEGGRGERAVAKRE